MSSRDQILNGGAYCRSAFLAINKTAVAAGSGDNTLVTSAFVDREMRDAAGAAQVGGLAMSAKLIITYTAALGNNETLSFAVQARDAVDAAGADAANYGDVAMASTVVATADSGGSTEVDTAEVDIDLASARQFIGFQITPNLSRGATDTAEWSANIVFFGHSRTPISKAIASIR